MSSALTRVEQQRLAELEEAFELFNQTSSHLTLAYEALQSQVVELQARLVASGQEKRRVSDRLKQLLNLLPAGVIVLNPQGVVVEMNPGAESILGKDAVNRLWSVVVDNVFLMKNNAGEFFTHDKVCYQLSSSPLRVEQEHYDPSSLGKILLIQDVSAAKDLQSHVARHQRLSSLGDMAASLAHQIRTPLSSALLYTSQMDGKQLTYEQQQKSVSKSLKSLKHLDSLVKDMLQYAKGGRVHDQEISMKCLLESLQHSSEITEKSSQVTILFPKNIPDLVIMGDLDALLTALQNLIDNAVNVCEDYCDLDFKVTVKVAKGLPGRVDVMIVDEGPGLSEDLQDKVFEPFYTSRAKGTGLGLAVVRSVAEAHNGEAWVSSVEGSGATFGISLPLFKQEGLE